MIKKMGESGLLFVVPSSGPACKDTIWETYGDVIYLENNKTPMMEALLSVRSLPNYNKYEYIFCVHDDVYLIDRNFIEQYHEAFERFDYWGVAGTNMMLSSDPRWHVAFRNKKYCAGLMEHIAPDDSVRFITSFGPYPLPVSVFDGVFMAFRKRAFDAITNVPELDGFHMYDMEMCTQLWEKKFRGGVMGLHLYHESRGEGILTDNWKKYADIYSKRWSKYTIIGG